MTDLEKIDKSNIIFQELKMVLLIFIFQIIKDQIDGIVWFR